MKNLLVATLAGLTVALTSTGSAVAGLTHLVPVTFGTQFGLQTAKGSLRDARDSADNLQFINCSVYAYDSTPDNHDTVCVARDATGAFRLCGANTPAMRDAAADATAGIDAASHVYFVINADGSCGQISVVRRSIYL
jgi:hypothetical protein